MKILFSFESCRMPLRAATFINWLIYKGHVVDVLYDINVCHSPMEAPEYLKNATVIDHVCDYEIYDVWFIDLLNYINYSSLSFYNDAINSYNNIACVVSFDDGPDFFDHRLDSSAREKIYCWLNNLLELDLEKYNHVIRDKCMLLPTYMEASNENYHVWTQSQNNQITPFNDKQSTFYFSGAITGCLPVLDCRVNSIIHLTRANVPYDIRVTGSDPAPFLKHFYDHCIDNSLKRPHVGPIEYLTELNANKFLLSPKGNCQALRRQYEGFAFNNLVFINDNYTTRYLCEGIPNYHYVSYKADCSDLKEKIRYYYNNINEGHIIADNGTEYWRNNCIIHPNGELSSYITTYLVQNFERHTGIQI